MVKIERKYRKKTHQDFSGRVEISITGLDEKGNRMQLHLGDWRRSMRVSDTTVEEVYNTIYEAIIAQAEGDDENGNPKR